MMKAIGYTAMFGLVGTIGMFLLLVSAGQDAGHE
jgi:hypothetical protein